MTLAVALVPVRLVVPVLLCVVVGCSEHEPVPPAELVSQSESTTHFCRDADPKLDLLFVIDDSASMAAGAVRLAEQLHSFANLLLAPGLCPFELRIAVTTTSTCNGDAGALVSGSCRGRLDDFVVADSEDGPAADIRDAACRDVCSLDAIDVQPSLVEGSADTSVRPWLQWGRFTNLPQDLDLADALACAVPVGVSGCTDETPLLALQAALQRSRDPEDPQHGFLRSDASLLAVIVAGEDEPQADVSSYVAMLRDLEAQKREANADAGIGVAIIGGVGIGYDTGATDGMGCMTDEVSVSPTPNLVAFATAIADGDRDGVVSACGDDYTVALSALFGPDIDQLRPMCIPFCLADGDPTTPELDPVCHAQRTETVSDAGISETLEVPLHPCLPDGAGGRLPPPGELRCLDVITDDEIEDECLSRGSNATLRMMSIAPSLPAGDTCIEVTCQVSLTPELDCPDL